MTDAIGQPWYDELNDEQKDRAWRQRNSSGLGTGAPPPSRYVDETDVISPASELSAGTTITWQRHTHEWSVPEPDPISGEALTMLMTERADGCRRSYDALTQRCTRHPA